MTALAFSVLALLSVGAPSMETINETVGVYRNLEFATYGTKSILLDLYVPRGKIDAAPCIVVIPGGGFMPQGREKFAADAQRFAEAGFAAASIGYRGRPDDPFPAAVHDAKAAVRFLRARAGLYGVDPARIGAFGQSAGGYLAAMLAVTKEQALEGDGGNSGISSVVQSAVSFAGVFDFIERFRETSAMANTAAKLKTNGEWIGAPFSPESALWRQASPYYHVAPGVAPMLLVHCKDDETVAWMQSEHMYEALKAVQPESRLLLLEKGGHSIRNARESETAAWDAAITFFRETLLRPQPELPFVPVIPPTHGDIKYGPFDRNVMDLWLASASGPTPLLVSIHGGGFRGGNKKVSNRLLTACLEAGISVAAITYRLTDEVIAPLPFTDAARAVQYIRFHAAEWNIDPSRIAANGDSAGAGISLWMGLHDDMADPKSEDPVLRQSTRLSCMAVENGQCSYDPRFIRTLIPEAETASHPALEYLFGVNAADIDHLPEEKYRLMEEVAAITHVSADDPPVLLLYNSVADAAVTSRSIGIHHPRFGFALKKKMDGAGIPCEVQCGLAGRGEERDESIMAFLMRELMP